MGWPCSSWTTSSVRHAPRPWTGAADHLAVGQQRVHDRARVVDRDEPAHAHAPVARSTSTTAAYAPDAKTWSDAKRARAGARRASRSSAAAATAEPPIAVERLANEPTPSGEPSVSPVTDRDRAGIDPEPVGGDLREQRLVALAARGRADRTTHPPSSPRVTSAYSYSPPERSTQSATPVPTSTSGARSGARRGGADHGPSRARGASGAAAEQLERAVQAALEVAGVVRPAERRPVGERAHEVAAAQLDRVEAELAGGGVDRRLDQVGRLRAAGAAVRARSGPCSCARR